MDRVEGMCRESDVFPHLGQWDFIWVRFWDFLDRIDQRDEARRCCCKSIVDLLTGRTKSSCFKLRDIRHMMPGGRAQDPWTMLQMRSGSPSGSAEGESAIGRGRAAYDGIQVGASPVGEFGEFCTLSCLRENRQMPKVPRPVDHASNEVLVVERFSCCNT